MRTPTLLALLALSLAACKDAGTDDSTAPDDSTADDSTADDSTADDSTADDSTPTDADGDGYTADVDCDDGDDAIHPGAQEICDGKDNDCDTLTDTADDSVDPSSAQTWYPDEDGDGYGAGEGQLSCDPLEGHAATADDCDDGDDAVHPAATEACNGADDDCDTLVDDADDSLDLGTATTWYEDGDGDGYGSSSTLACEAPTGAIETGGDCDDTEAGINPAAQEVCGGYDDDCDGLVDDEDDSVDTAGGSTWYTDGDGDGYGDPSAPVTACEQPAGTAENTDDCDDTDATVQPDATEVCDGLDNNCNGAADDEDDGVDLSTGSAWYPDTDGDGYGDPGGELEACDQPTGYITTGGDCDDDALAINPGALEVCNGSDDDCDGDTDDDDASVDLSTATTWFTDSDGDGYGDPSSSTQACTQPSGTSALDSDCDDAESTVSPGASELCNTGLDEDCSGDDNGCSPSGVYSPTDADLEYVGASSYNLGWVISVGDANGDGADDVLINAYTAKNAAGTSNVGRSYLFYGPLSGDVTAESDADAIFEGVSSADYLGKGQALSGDLDGDGYDDVVLGTYGYNGSTGTDSGGVSIFYGKSASYSGTINGLSSASALFYGDVKGDQLGQVVAILGDVNGDGYDELAVGANVSDVGGTNSGIGYVLAGSATRYSGTLKVGTYAGLTVVGEAGDKLGDQRNFPGPVDLDGDGLHDVVFGAVNNDGAAGADSGSVHVWYGSSSLLSLGQVNSTAADAIVEGSAASDYLGEEVASAGDVDGDGYGDLAMGAYGHDAGGGSYSAGGGVFLLYGSSTRESGTLDVSTAAGALLEGEATYDYIGKAVSAGDLNNDGFSDVFAGATGYDYGGLNTGGGFVWFGPLSGTLGTSDADVIVVGGIDKANGGRAGGFADVDNDGAMDLLVGMTSSSQVLTVFGGGL